VKEVLDKLIESLNSGNILLGVVIVAVAMVFNYKKIVEFLEERKKARITKLTDALKCDFVTGITKTHLQEELATEQFKITTGIRLEKQFREAVIQAHNSANGELAFIHFKRAIPHLFYEQSRLKVNVSTFEKASYWFNLVFGFILAFSGLALIVLPSQIEGINFVQFITFFGLSCFFIAIGVFMLAQTFPVVSARKIEKHLLGATHNNPIQPTAKASADCDVSCLEGNFAMDTASNKHGIERRKIKPKDLEKYLERKSAFRIDFRQRFDLFAKTVLVTTGGALTISMTLFLKDDAPKLMSEQLLQLKWIWIFLLYTLCSFSLGMFLTVLQGAYVNWRWENKIPLGDDQISGNKKMIAFRIIILLLGSTGFLAFLMGLCALGLVATDVIETTVANK
jgi:hypothetical protein